MTLPPELAPWASLLAGLADHLDVEVGRLARKLDAAIGPLRPRKPEPGGEPDGYRGLSRRGPYDRLLLSEWAYLDEVPDEFVRRAAQNEHAFYQIEHRSPKGGVRCEAVFDAGPESLGTPRIVHVAMLVVLARRAELGNAEFTWRVAQAPTVRHATVDPPRLRALLDARTGAPFAPPPVDAVPPDELWYIGGPAVRGHRAIACVIEDAVDPARDEIDVRIERPGRAPVELGLAVPAPSHRRRLILDPTRPPEAGSPVPRDRTKKSTHGSPAGDHWRPFPHKIKGPLSVRFLPGTEQVQAFFESGEILTWSLSNVDRKGVPKAKVDQYWGTDSLVAAGYSHQRTQWIVRRVNGELGVFGVGVHATPKPVPLPPAGRGLMVRLPPDDSRKLSGCVLFTDSIDQLWIASCKAGETEWEVRLSAWKALAMGTDPDGAFALAQDGDRWTVAYVNGDGTFGSAPDRHEGQGAWLVHRYGYSLEYGRVAVWQGREIKSWPIFRSVGFDGALSIRWGEPTAFAAPPGRVIGVATGRAGTAETHGVIAVSWEESSCSFVRAPDGARFTVPRVPVEPSLSPNGEFVTFRTAERTVEVWRVEGGTPVMLRHEDPE